mmetsp:Transcript_3574/g.8635  ORF Transcript_3574/g.8635 Transcript_3574/m.8635 type:complete len:106 (-) Transcript_3574:614-931(-)
MRLAHQKQPLRLKNHLAAMPRFPLDNHLTERAFQTDGKPMIDAAGVEDVQAREHTKVVALRVVTKADAAAALVWIFFICRRLVRSRRTFRTFGGRRCLVWERVKI